MHRDINDIIPPSRRRSMDAMPVAPRPSAPLPPPALRDTEMPSPPTVAVPPMRSEFSGGRPSKGRFPFGTAIIAGVVVLASAGVLYAFAGAKVTINPVVKSATITSDISATAGQGDLPFQIVSVEKVATASVPAESTVTANDPAQGKITVTNKQANTQALIKNTRFSTPDGLIFRIHDSITVPAGGSVSVSVYADEPGVKYNIAPSTFVIPGLKGGKAYDLVTAKSDAPMLGGFSGSRPSVAQTTKDKQYATMQATLTTQLQKDLSAKIPPGYVLLPGASFPTYEPQPDAAGASGTVALSEKGTITAVIFPEGAIAATIAKQAFGTYNGEPVTLGNVSKLLVKPVQPTIAPDAATFDFNLSGDTTVVWVVDSEKISGAVASKTRSGAESALQSFPEVDKATLVLRPFWANTFPADPKKIKVVVTPASPSK